MFRSFALFLIGLFVFLEWSHVSYLYFGNQTLGQWNRTESPEINPCLYGQLIFNKGYRNIKCSKGSLFSKQCLDIWTATCKKNETWPPTYTIHKNKLRMEKDISHDTLKVLEENIGRKISGIPHSNIFADMSPRARDIKERINKWDLIKIKSFSTAKENSSKM